MEAMVSMESTGLSEHWLVCCPPWMQARHHHCMPSGSETELFYLYRHIFIIHLEVCESIITMSLWLSQPCNSKIYIAEPLMTFVWQHTSCTTRTLIVGNTNYGKHAKTAHFMHYNI